MFKLFLRNKKYKDISTSVSKTRVIYKIEGMDCSSCASLIQIDLEDKGYKCKCSYSSETLEIEGEHNLSEIIEIVKKSGYTLKA